MTLLLSKKGVPVRQFVSEKKKKEKPFEWLHWSYISIFFYLYFFDPIIYFWVTKHTRTDKLFIFSLSRNNERLNNFFLNPSRINGNVAVIDRSVEISKCIWWTYMQSFGFISTLIYSPEFLKRLYTIKSASMKMP